MHLLIECTSSFTHLTMALNKSMPEKKMQLMPNEANNVWNIMRLITLADSEVHMYSTVCL